MSFFLRKKTVLTHNGSFHADDVLAVATLKLRFGKLRIVRTRDEEKFKSAEFLVDVGSIYSPENKRFDHHQVGGAGERYNGIPYASFGLVWKEYGKDICGGDVNVAKIIDERLVSYIDSMDNGFGELKEVANGVIPYTIGMAIVAFNKTWRGNDDNYNNFIKAVVFAESFLQREISLVKDESSGMKLVKRAYEESTDKRLIILEAKYPWEFVLKDFSEPVFVITPNKDNNTWEVNAVRDNPLSFKNRKDFPIEWAGKRNKELSSVTGVEDAIFAHNGRFFVVCKSKEGAIKLANLALSL